MKFSTSVNLLTLLCCTIAACFAFEANASNKNIEATLQTRPELALFYQAMVETGVLADLQDSQSYTVFAPVNDTFAKVVPQDTCYKSEECKVRLAAILRDHVIPGKRSIDSLSDQADSIRTIGSHAVSIAKASQVHSDYTVDGHKITGEHDADKSLIYSIDSPIAEEKDLAELKVAEAEPAEKPHPNVALAPIVPRPPSLVAPPAR